MSEPFGRNLVRRVLTAAVVLPAVLAVIAFFPPRGAYFVAALFCVVGIAEAHTLLSRGGRTVSHWAFFPGLTVFFALAGLPDARPAFVEGLPFIAAVIAAYAAVRRAEREGVEILGREAGGALAGLVIGAGAGAAAGLATMDPLDRGVQRVLLLIAIVVASDVAAFFVGHAIGKTRLAPAVSPGKTVEGAIGGLAGAAVASAVASRWLFPEAPMVLMAGLGALCAAAGIVGDLLESLFKRAIGVKDSGALFPGHGGALDRMDAFLFAAPLLYAFFAPF